MKQEEDRIEREKAKKRQQEPDEEDMKNQKGDTMKKIKDRLNREQDSSENQNETNEDNMNTNNNNTNENETHHTVKTDENKPQNTEEDSVKARRSQDSIEKQAVDSVEEGKKNPPKNLENVDTGMGLDVAHDSGKQTDNFRKLNGVYTNHAKKGTFFDFR